MKCNNCGHALGNISPKCPNCGMIMTSDQLKTRKDINGYNNPYMQRLQRLEKESLKYKIEEKEKPNNKGIYILFIILLVIILLIILINLINR